jgi:hypothetical protein
MHGKKEKFVFAFALIWFLALKSHRTRQKQDF